MGFPIRTSPDQSLVSGSPKLIAATRVLLRLLSPRHPHFVNLATSSCAYAVVKDRKSRCGGADRDRTDDFQLAKLALSQLSYGPRWLVGLDRFELSTPRLSSVCSNQLSYRPSPLPGSARIRSTSDLQRAEGRPFGPSRLEASPRKTNCALT